MSIFRPRSSTLDSDVRETSAPAQSERDPLVMKWIEGRNMPPDYYPSPDLAERIRRREEATDAGMHDGFHYSTYPDEVKDLMRNGKLDQAEVLLLQLVDSVERESAIQGVTAPWYYERLAILYRKQKAYQKEIEILDRYAASPRPRKDRLNEFMVRKQRAQELLDRASVAPE